MGKQADRTYSCVVTITAKNEELADEMRSEIAGAAEDNHESGEINADATVGPLVAGDIDQKLEKYRALHDRLSDLIEDGKLADLRQFDPKGYEGLVNAMTELAGLDPKPLAELGKLAYALG